MERRQAWHDRPECDDFLGTKKYKQPSAGHPANMFEMRWGNLLNWLK
jgi:hypothetical protein